MPKLVLGFFYLCGFFCCADFRACHGSTTYFIHKCKKSNMLNIKPATIRATDSIEVGCSRNKNHQVSQQATDKTVNWSRQRWHRPIFFQNQC